MALWKVSLVTLGILTQISAGAVCGANAQAKAEPSPASISKTAKPRCTGLIRARGIRFAENASTIGVRQSEILDKIIQVLKSCPDRTVQIEGHTDALGSKAFNQALAERRAHAVKEYLVQHGIPAERLVVVGFGNRRPIASSATAEGRALNRRVTLRFLKNT